MTNNRKRRAASKSGSIGRISIFGPPPILEGEDSATYDELLARVTGHIKPTDVIEEIFIRDVVDLTWENLRWRRLKAGLFHGDLLNKLETLLNSIVRRPSVGTESTNSYPELIHNFNFTPPPPTQEETFVKQLVKKWAMRDPAAIDRVAKLLASSNKSVDSVVASIFLEKLESIERIDRLITVAEARRNFLLREIDRHRSPLAQTLRGTVQEIETTALETVKPRIAPKNMANKNAA